MPEPLSKGAYAAHRGVHPSLVSVWIRRKKLTAPALRDDGKIDAGLADAKLSTPRKRAERSHPSAPMTPDMIRAAALATVFGALESSFFPHVVVDAALTLTQRAGLARSWDRFRRQVSMKG
jgi:hypothetical protein